MPASVAFAVLAARTTPRSDGLAWSLGAEALAVVLVAVTVAIRDGRRRRQVPEGTLYQAGAAVDADALARQGALRNASPLGDRDPIRRPVHTYSGTILLTPGELSWRPDSYSRRHGGRRLVLPLGRVRWAEAHPRLGGLGSLLAIGFDDATQIRFVARGRPDHARGAFARAGIRVTG